VDGERRAYRLARRTLLLTTHGLRERPLPDPPFAPDKKVFELIEQYINRCLGRRVADEVLVKANEAFSEVFYL
jgi:hypothetical protein